MRFPQPVRDLFDSYREVTAKNFSEIYHDAVQQRDEALNLFNLGYLSWNCAASRKTLLGHLRQNSEGPQGERLRRRRL